MNRTIGKIRAVPPKGNIFQPARALPILMGSGDEE
jgi:hypothetical protein